VRNPNTEPNNTTGKAKLMEAVRNKERKKCCTVNKQFLRKIFLKTRLNSINQSFYSYTRYR
jgi:hypothetical protein